MNTAKHVALSFSDRCAIAAACLPKADYRTQLERLHAEMLAALETARADADRRGRLQTAAISFMRGLSPEMPAAFDDLVDKWDRLHPEEAMKDKP